eukprot:COSAG02_NODE_3714_length_6334_cov_7.283400_2_plen_1122_part_00
MSWSDDEDIGFGFGRSKSLEDSDDFESSWDAPEVAANVKAAAPEPAEDEDLFTLEGASGFLPPIRDTSSPAHEEPPPRAAAAAIGSRSSPLTLPDLSLSSPRAGVSSLDSRLGPSPPSGLGAVALVPLVPPASSTPRPEPAVDAAAIRAQAQREAEALEAERKQAEADAAAFRLALEQEAAKRKAIADAEAQEQEKARQEELVRQAAARLEAERAEAERLQRVQEENERQQRKREEEAREQARHLEEARAAQAAEEEAREQARFVEEARAAQASEERRMKEAQVQSHGDTSNASGSDYADDDFDDDFEDDDSDGDGGDNGNGSGDFPGKEAMAAQPWAEPEPEPELRSHAPHIPGPRPEPEPKSDAFATDSTNSISGSRTHSGDGPEWSPKGYSSQVPPFGSSLGTAALDDSGSPSGVAAASNAAESHGSLSALDRLAFEASVAEGASHIADEMGKELAAEVTKARAAVEQAEANDHETARTSTSGSGAADYSDEDFEDYADDDDFEDDDAGQTSEDKEHNLFAHASVPVSSERDLETSPGQSLSPIGVVAAPAAAPSSPVKSLLDTLDAAAGDKISLPPANSEAAGTAPKVQQPDLQPTPSAQPTAPKVKQSELKPAPPVQPKPTKLESQSQMGMRARTRVEVASLKPVPPPAGTAPPSNGAFSKAVHTERDVEQWRKKKNREARRKAREAKRLAEEVEAKELAKKAAVKAALEAANARRKRREAKQQVAIREKKRKKKEAKAKAAAELAAAMEAEARAKEEERLREEEKKRMLRERGRAVIEQQRLARKKATEEKRLLRLERRLAAMEREHAVALVSDSANEKIKLNALASRVAQLENEIQAEEHEIDQLKLPAIDMPAAQVQSARTPHSKKMNLAPGEERGWVTNRTPKEATDPKAKAANDMARSRRAEIKENDGRRRQNNRDLLRKKRAAQKQIAAAKRNAATKLQCVYRGFSVRLNATRAATMAREQNEAATLLGANWRGARTRRHFQGERRAAEVAAADAVLGSVLRNWFPQRQLWRRRRTHAETQRKLQELASQELGASQIQAVYRGHRTRKEQKWRDTQEGSPQEQLSTVPMVLAPVPPAPETSQRKKHHRRGVVGAPAVVTANATPSRAIWL